MESSSQPSPGPWFHLLAIGLLSLGLCRTGVGAEIDWREIEVSPPSELPMPHERWAVDLWGGSLSSVGGRASPLDYTLVSALPSFRTPAHLHIDFAGGDLVMRPRFGLWTQPIIEGPESYFVGPIAGPSIEWWAPDGKTALLLGAGGGIGWLDSRGDDIDGAQSQDFNLTWYAMAGIERRISDRWAVMAGAWYQHISNGGMSDPNPGIDAFGPMLGITWSF